METQLRQYINRCRSYINFMLSQQQWSGITKHDINHWLENFAELSTQEQSLIYKLLTNLIYFSEKDVINALKDGIYNRLFYQKILYKQKAANFELSAKALTNIVNEELNASCFIPLLDSDSPHESANYITRLLVQEGLISTRQSMFISNLETAIASSTYKRIVIIDDCIGSGHQLTSFWQKQTISLQSGKTILLRQFCKDQNVEAIYLSLFGYDKNIASLQTSFDDLKILCIRELSDEQRVFQDNTYIWENPEDKDIAIKFLSGFTQEKGIPLLGYNNLDFAFIMHRTIPDWSLPLFWMENPDWNLLIRRKNSNA